MTKLLIIPCGEGIEKTREYKSEELGHSSAIYLHGKLERMARYDIVDVLVQNLEETGLGRKSPVTDFIGDEYEVHKDKCGNAIYWTTPYIENAVLDVTVDGVDEPCVGIFWVNKFCPGRKVECDGETYLTGWWQCGLVCLKSDKEAIEHALKKQKEGGYC